MDLNETIFTELFKQVCRKCFGHPLSEPLSESDSNFLSNQVFEKTGLVIGVKSIKNYSQYIFNRRDSKRENPSVATLDTLARYLLNAPYTDEIQRKKNESHHPYWFQYKSSFQNAAAKSKKHFSWRKIMLAVIVIIVTLASGLLVKYLLKKSNNENFSDDFTSVDSDSLKMKGWKVKDLDTAYWMKRGIRKGNLALYTLKGDNWPDSSGVAGIRNLLIRPVDADCFSTEIHLIDFIPHQNWQQAGILLSEDSTFKGKVLRMSIGFNNFFGGYNKPAEIIIQVVGSSESGNFTKPEEFAHVTLFNLERGKDSLVTNNLLKSSLKIEKKQNHFRFLYTNGRMEDFAFKEASHVDFNITPKYIGIFAMQGNTNSENAMPVFFDSFSFTKIDCNK